MALQTGNLVSLHRATAHLPRRIVRVVGLAAFVMLGYGLLAGASAQAALSAGDTFRGHFAAQPDATIRLRVIDRGSGRANGVLIRVPRVDEACEGGSEPDALIMGGHLGKDGRFDVASVTEPELGHNDFAIDLAQGRLRPSGRAEGLVFHADDPFDPADEPGNLDECWTDGLLRWTAEGPGQRRRRGATPRAAAQRNTAKAIRRQFPGDLDGTYAGDLGSKKRPVRLEIRHGRASFTAEPHVVCDFGIEAHDVTVEAADLPVRRDGRFRFLGYDKDPVSGDRTFVRIWGQAKPNGSAKGQISYMFDPFDPYSTTNEPECTIVQLPWKAAKRHSHLAHS